MAVRFEDWRTTYAFQRRWLDEVLTTGDSFITPGQPVWRRANVDDLRDHFLKARESNSGSFLDKLKVQPSDAARAAKVRARSLDQSSMFLEDSFARPRRWHHCKSDHSGRLREVTSVF